MTSATGSDSYENEKPAQSQTDVFPLVGLGASAGGIHALQTFFEGLPPESGMAYVVVLHLSPEHESNLAQILQQRTTMPVIQVTESVQVAPDHVYVIPPGKHLAMEDSHIHLVEPQQPTGRRVAIDLFFRTLAAAYGPRAVAIVLSGTDSDGVIGIKHVKEQGGITIAQDPTDAEFDSMPRNAIATGMVDWILPVAQMSPQLMRFIQNEHRLHVPPEEPQTGAADNAGDTNSGGPLVIQKVPSAADEDALAEALRFVRGQTGHDFSHYKRATILRRIARRLQVNLLEDIPSYLAFLRSHPAEVTALLHDLLISVTNFFRDHDAFAVLESHIPQLFAGKQAGDQVRVWAAGCATGEEAYSVAILLLEHAARLDVPPAMLVFATDLDEDVIQIARAGIYPFTIEADVSAERLRRFFQKEQGGYRIRKEVRELTLFSSHNLLKDSPFSRLELVTCRNLLIYLKRESQEGVFDLFHFALRPGGLLFLGNSESLDDNHALFAPLDKRRRLYVRRTVPRPGWQIPTLPLRGPHALSAPVLPRLPAPRIPSENFDRERFAALPSSAERRAPLFGDLHLTLLERYAPPSVVVDANYDIAHLSEHAGRFLHIAGGEPSLNLLKVVHPGLRLELRTALFRAVQSQADVTIERVPVELEGVPHLVNIHVRPARKPEAGPSNAGSEEISAAGNSNAGPNEAGGFLLVVFEPIAPGESPSSTPASDTAAVARHLEEESRHLRAQLGATVEQYEAAVEDLKASNEELQAMNEEMRSATEELETGKEELQSINEELTTVNQELKSSVEELSRANSDLQNLMASTEIATVFLDRQMRIHRFTPGAQELFNLIATDIGRPLSDITHRLHYPGLTADAERVLRDLRTNEREVSSGGRWFLGRILPYRTAEDYIDGVVLTFVDISGRKRAEESLRSSEERMRLTLENVTDYAIFNLDAEGRVASWNEGGRRMLGYLPGEIIGAHFRVFYHEADRNAGVPDRALETARAAGRYEDEGWRVRKDGSAFWGNEILTAVHDAHEALIGFVKIARDLTRYRQAEEARLALERETTLLLERNRMAQELHDTLSQGFTGIKMQMDAAETALQAQEAQEAQSRTEEATETIGAEKTSGDGEAGGEQEGEAMRHIRRARAIAQQSLVEARTSIRALRAPLLANGSLVAALQNLADQAPEGVKARFFSEGTPFPLAALAENDLYRIAQEALTNALRHAQAGTVALSLTYFEQQVHLTIKDDGRGFDTRLERAGFGITGMHERAGRLHADLQITSRAGEGTEVALILDISTGQQGNT